MLVGRVRLSKCPWRGHILYANVERRGSQKFKVLISRRRRLGLCQENPVSMAKSSEGGERIEAKESLNIWDFRQVTHALTEYIEISENLVIK